MLESVSPYPAGHVDGVQKMPIWTTAMFAGHSDGEFTGPGAVTLVA
jgi:hypothetical protein